MTVDDLQGLLVTLTQKERASITAATPMKSLFEGSLGLARLDAALRSSTGVSYPRVYKVATFGELCEMVAGSNGVVSSNGSVTAHDAPTVPVAGSIATGDTSAGLQAGIDIESISALPEASDYWEHEFYKATFTPREIAFALLQHLPRETFAGMWCAKEAVRKASADLAHVEWTQIEVIHSEAGKPKIAARGQSLAGALSISHSGGLAVAVFVSGSSAQPLATPNPAPQNPSPAPPVIKTGNRTTAALAYLAFLVSIVALLLALLRR